MKKAILLVALLSTSLIYTGDGPVKNDDLDAGTFKVLTVAALACLVLVLIIEKKV